MGFRAPKCSSVILAARKAFVQANSFGVSIQYTCWQFGITAAFSRVSAGKSEEILAILKCQNRLSSRERT